MRRFLQVTASGSPREIGRGIGRATAPLLTRLVAENSVFYRRETGRSLKFIRSFAMSRYFGPAARRYPDYAEELRGMAEGAGLPFEDLFVFSCEEEMLDLWGRWDKCTSASVRSRRGLYLAHNEDYVRRYRGNLVIVQARPSGRPAFVSLGYPATLAGSSTGLNAAGIAMSGNSLHYPPRRRGVPKNFILRDVLAARNLADAVRRVRVPERTIGHSVNLVSARERRAAFVECSLREIAVVPMGESDVLMHTNHVLSPELDTHAETASWNSRLRYAGIEFLLARRRDSIDAKRLQAALSSTAHFLLRRGRRPDDPETLASVVMDAGRGVMWVANRAVTDDPYVPYRVR